jgi:hypothetical protein
MAGVMNLMFLALGIIDGWSTERDGATGGWVYQPLTLPKRETLKPHWLCDRFPICHCIHFGTRFVLSRK